MSLGVSQYAREQGDWVLHVDDQNLLSIPFQLAQGWTGAGIITRTLKRAWSNALKCVSCPIVELQSARKETCEVIVDTDLEMEFCIKYYLDKCVSSIAFYGFGRAWWVEERRKSFLKKMDQFGLTGHCFVDISTRTPSLYPPWSNTNEKLLIRWLKTLPMKTGFITPADYQAIRILNTCQKIGIAIPEQMAVLGLNNDEYLCNLVTPSLSSLDQNAEMIGYRAAELLNQKMTRGAKWKNNTNRIPILVPPKGIVTRRSTEICMVEDEEVAAALRFITEFALQGIRVADVTNHVNVSHSTLCRRFFQVLNRSPHDEITRVRMEHAKCLLAKTNMSIHTIASKTCYCTIRYFTEVFRRHTGQTPASYRKEAWKFHIPKTHGEQQ